MPHHVLFYRREPINLVSVGGHAGLVDIRTLPVRSHEWSYVDDQDGGIIAATIFPTERQAEQAMALFRLPPWIVSRELTNLEITVCRL